MSLYDRLKVRKLPHQLMHDYLIEIQYTCDNLASYCHPIEEIQQISIILNGVKGQYDDVVVVIHASRNPYEIASVCSVLLYAETQRMDLLFDIPPSINVVTKNDIHRSRWFICCCH